MSGLSDAESLLGHKHSDWGFRRVFVQADVEGIITAREKALVEEIVEAIEKRRLSRRRRWLRSHRWSGEDEARWSQGMWDAARIAREFTKGGGES